MAIGEPMRNYAMASLPNSGLNIASFGIAKSLANFFEAPIIMVLHASNALARDSESSKQFLRFTLIFSLLLSGLFLCLAIPNVFEFIATKIFNLSIEVSETTKQILYLIFLFPFIIGWRRYFQGLLIQQKKNKVVANAALVRLFFVIAIPLVGMQLSWSGLACAIGSLLGGLLIESLYVTYYCFRFQSFDEVKKNTNDSLPRTYGEIFKYYFPLGYSMIVIWGTRALLVLLLSFAVDSTIALALWPIIWGLVLVVSNGTRMVQQVYISNKDDFSEGVIKMFNLSVALVFTIILVMLVFTQLGNNLVVASIGELAEYKNLILTSMGYFLFFPGLTVIQNILQGKLILQSKTKAIGVAAIPSHLLLAIVAFILIKVDYSGITALALSLNVGLICENLLLWHFGESKNRVSITKEVFDGK